MSSSSSFICFNYNLFINFIDLYGDNKSLDSRNFSNLDLKDFLTSLFEARCEAVVKIEEVGRENVRRCDTLALSMSQFSSLSHKDMPVGLRDMGTGEEPWVLQAGVEMAL